MTPPSWTNQLSFGDPGCPNRWNSLAFYPSSLGAKLDQPRSNSVPEKIPRLGVILQLQHLKSSLLSPNLPVKSQPLLLTDWEPACLWGVTGRSGDALYHNLSSLPCPMLCPVCLWLSRGWSLQGVSLGFLGSSSALGVSQLLHGKAGLFPNKGTHRKQAFMRPMGQMAEAAELGFPDSIFLACYFHTPWLTADTCCKL